MCGYYECPCGHHLSGGCSGIPPMETLVHRQHFHPDCPYTHQHVKSQLIRWANKEFENWLPSTLQGRMIILIDEGERLHGKPDRGRTDTGSTG